MTIEISLLISGVSVAFAIFFGIVSLSRAKKQDTESEAKQNATVLTEIGYIKSNTDEIKTEQKEQRNVNTTFLSRLITAELAIQNMCVRLEEHIGKDKKL